MGCDGPDARPRRLEPRLRGNDRWVGVELAVGGVGRRTRPEGRGTRGSL